jgi:hypothetical protein
MTQMIGRALRGERAGGTKEAYIVSFVDKWQEHIAWVNPATLLDEGEFVDKKKTIKKKDLQLISIAKIEEFARLLDETVDTSELEELDFMSRVPLGMYAFSYLDGEMERNYQVLVYDSTKAQYEAFIENLPELMDEYGVTDEIIPDELLDEISKDVAYAYFDKYMLPTYDGNDIIALLKYFAQNEIEPNFIPFDELDRKKVDLAQIAHDLVSNDLKRSEEKEVLNKLWNDEDGIMRIYFSKWTYFKRQLDIEVDKVNGDFITGEIGNNVVPEYRKLSELSMNEIAKNNPSQAAKLKRMVYEKCKNENGSYYCACCGFVSRLAARFQIDHIKPFSKGGKTDIDNLQLLCVQCNKHKGNMEVDIDI